MKGLQSVPNLEGQMCFGCGDANFHGLRMRFYRDEHRVYSFLSVPEGMVGWGGIVHGGILSTILDEIMGWTVIALLGGIGVTKKMTVDFLHPVSVGTRIKVVGSVQEQLSERTAVITGAIYDEEERKCAGSTGTFSVMSPRTAVRIGVANQEYMQRFETVLNQSSSGNLKSGRS